MRKIIILLVVSFVLNFQAISVFALEQLIIEGTGDSQLLLRQLGERFEQINPDIHIIVPESIGSSGGIKALIKGKSHMARVARPLKKREMATADNLVYLVFAYSPVVFIANLPTECIDNLTTKQVVGIFSGTVANWSELGACPEHKIYVAMREEGDSSRTIIEKKLPGVKDIVQFTGKVIYSTPEALSILEEHPYTFGYLPYGTVSRKLQVMALDGVPPGEAQVLDGHYPLVSPLGLVWKGRLSDAGKKFLTFLSSDEGKNIMRQMKVVPAAEYNF